jgi:hypothetical protein
MLIKRKMTGNIVIRLNNYSQKVKDEVNSINFKEKDVPGVPENFPELMFEPNDEDINNPDDSTIQTNDALILGYVDMPERIRGAYNIKKIKKEDLLEDIVLNRLDALKRPLALKSVSYQKEELYSAKINPIGKSEINLRAKSLALSLIRKMHVEEAKNKLIGKVSTIKSCMFALYFIVKNLKSESMQIVSTDSPIDNRDQEEAKSIEEKQNENNANMPHIENGKMITNNFEIDIQGLTAYLTKFKEIEKLKKAAPAKQ